MHCNKYTHIIILVQALAMSSDAESDKKERTQWPRIISTKATGGTQVIVNSKEEALAHFKAANYLDRIRS